MSLYTPPESKPASPSNLTRSGHCDSTPSHNKREVVEDILAINDMEGVGRLHILLHRKFETFVVSYKTQ